MKLRALTALAMGKRREVEEVTQVLPVLVEWKEEGLEDGFIQPVSFVVVNRGGEEPSERRKR